MSVLHHPALLLKAIPYGESDLVVHLLTREEGKVAALARGARKSRKRFGAVLDYFTLFRAALKKGRGMVKLEGVELIRRYGAIPEDLARYLAAGHMVELSGLGLAEGEPGDAPFALLDGALATLERGADAASLVRIFQIRFLALLGYGLGAGHCSRCGAPPGEAPRVVDHGLACAACAGGEGAVLSAGAQKTLARAERLAPEALSSLRLPSAIERELAPVLRDALEAAVGRRLAGWAALQEALEQR